MNWFPRKSHNGWWTGLSWAIEKRDPEPLVIFTASIFIQLDNLLISSCSLSLAFYFSVLRWLSFSFKNSSSHFPFFLSLSHYFVVELIVSCLPVLCCTLISKKHLWDYGFKIHDRYQNNVVYLLYVSVLTLPPNI